MRLTNRGKIFFTALAIIILSIIIIIVAFSGNGSGRSMQVYAVTMPRHMSTEATRHM